MPDKKKYFETMVANSYDQLRLPALNFIQQFKEHHDLVIIGANKGVADDFAYSAVESVLIGLHRFELLQFAREVTRNGLAEIGLIPGEAIALEALSALVSFEAEAAHELRFLDQVVRRPRFARALCRTLSELRLERVDLEDLRSAGAPGQDLAILLERYTASLKEHRLADSATTLALASEVIAAGKHQFCGAPLVLVCPPTSNAAERHLLRSLVLQAPALLALGTIRERTELEAITGVSARELTTQTYSCATSIRSYLFSTSGTPPRQPDSSFELFSAAGEALECVEIARRIHALARTGGVRFDRMAVLLRTPASYQPVLQEAFARADVPARFSDGVLLPHRAGRAFLALLEFARTGFSAAKFGEYVSLHQVPELLDEEHGVETNKSVGLWERVILEVNIVGGQDRWKARLQAGRIALEKAIGKEEDDRERERATRKLLALDTLAAFVLPLIDLLVVYPTEASWRKWLGWLRKVASAGVRDSELIAGLLDCMEPLAEIGPVTFEQVLHVLSESLRTVRKFPTDRRWGRVFVGDPTDAEGMTFDIVFIPGLAEGNFPRPLNEDPLLLNEARRQVRADLRVVSEDDERRQLEIAVAASSGTIISSFPRMDLLSGRARVPSLYAFELAKAAGLDVTDLKLIEESARTRVTTRATWPAPKLPADAIDDAEFDLAQLRPALEEKHSRGLGAYLTKSSATLVRSLRARYLRWNDDRWNFRDGYIEQEIESTRPLAKHALTARAYSASALEVYAECPYRFYLRHIYGVRPKPSSKPSWRMDPLDRGRIFHHAAALFVHERRKTEAVSMYLEEKLDLMDKVLSEVAAEFAQELAIQVPLAWSSELQSLQTDLRGLVREMERDQEWMPIAAELSFGMAEATGSDPQSVAQPVGLDGLVLLRGAIDRVDKHARGLLRIVDYKTGAYLKADRPVVVHGGQILQPLLYALAAHRIFNLPVKGGRLLYSTTRGRYRNHSIELSPENEEVLRTCIEQINTAVLNGFLPAAPVEKACERCDYRKVCGPYEGERQRRKKDKLVTLQEMRKMA